MRSTDVGLPTGDHETIECWKKILRRIFGYSINNTTVHISQDYYFSTVRDIKKILERLDRIEKKVDKILGVLGAYAEEEEKEV